MAVYAKKKKSFIAKFFIAIFWIILILALIFGAVWGYFYFAKNVNVVSAITQFSALSVSVDESTIVTNAPTSADTTNVNTKMQTTSINSDLTITDKEFCAYINNQIESNNVTFNLGGEINAKDINLEVLQVVFATPSQSGDILTNINITFKFNTSFLKEKLSTFPLSLVSKSIPETIYVSADGELLSTASGDYSYSVNPTGIKLNTLNASDSANLLNFVNVFVNCGDSQTLNTQILKTFCDKLIGNSQKPGMFYQLASKAPTGYELSYNFGSGTFNISVDVAKYEVKVIQTLGSTQNVNASTITGTGSDFDYFDNNSTTLTVVENNGYYFLGWYDSEHMLVSNATTLAVNNITKDLLYYAQFEYITETISYNLNGKVCDNDNPTSYNISNGTIVLKDLHLTGYDFLGWYKNDTELITQIDASTMENYVLYAHWQLKTYSITYVLNEGVEQIANPTTYTIETSTFTLNNPIKSGTTFTGWTGSNLTSKTMSVTIEKGSSVGNLTYYAHYANDPNETYTVTLIVDGVETTSFEATADVILQTSLINSKVDESEYKLTEYSVENWYTDSTQQTLYSPENLTTNLTLYGSWTYFMDNMLFMPYVNEFEYANNHNTKTMDFDSQDKLVAWIDYVIFYHVTRTENQVNSSQYPGFNLTYISGGSDAKKAEIVNAYKNVWATQIHYQSVSYSYMYLSNCFVLSESDVDEHDITKMGTVKTTNKTLVKGQNDNAMAIDNTSPRTTNNFPIDNVTKTISNISNTEQLVRALEQGYKPICVSDSSAESVYNDAKNVLKEICNDNMTDVQKLQAIYEWLTLNVQYDYNIIQDKDIWYSNYYNEYIKTKSSSEATQLATQATSAKTRIYEAWFPEGVFNSGLAVCEGYAKSALIMARIEGIPAVYVVGNGHAWNKVQVNGVWYEFDATHADGLVDNTETTTYTKFLFPSSYRTDYVATYYTNLICNTNYDFYANANYSYNLTQFDLSINSQSELELLLNYVKTNTPSNISSSTYSVEFASTLSNISSVFYYAKSSVGVQSWTLTTQNKKDCCGKYVYNIILNK